MQPGDTFETLSNSTFERECECGRGVSKGYQIGGRGEPYYVSCSFCCEEKQEQAAAEERERARGLLEAKRRERMASLSNILDHIGITRKYLGVTLEGFNPNPDSTALEHALAFVDQFRAGDRPSLYLFSSRPGESIAPGSGKTHLAVSVLRELVLTPEIEIGDLGFCFVPRMLLEIQATFKHPEKSELSIVKKYAAPELLVWDDFGAEKLSDYAARTLYTILYEREGKSNIFTSNLSLGDMEARDPSGYTQRITSRIAGDAKIIRMVGPDRRLNAA